ncbi:MAG: hypothetical protein DRO92_04215 [Candidatus Altiarchaeales archaeon]|nr:MAG: hypothetical protein DRO92_04215 [Candidatus Altiarchaeales archaeon]
MELRRYVAIPAVYEYLINHVFSFFDVKEIYRVIDLGAGSGAFINFLSRYYPYWHIEGADNENFVEFGLKDRFKFTRVDLNKSFSRSIKGKFDLITAIEVIEHLENPRHFLRECNKLLKVGGKLIITPPNIESIPGRLRFLVRGNFKHFDSDPKFNEPTHITPIQSYLFSRAARDTGFRVIKQFYFPPGKFYGSRSIVKIAALIISPFLHGHKFGEKNIFLLEKING